MSKKSRTELPEPDELTMTIARHLEIDNQYVEFIGARDIHRIAEVRSAGRKAGRLLGWKIMAYPDIAQRRRQSNGHRRRPGMAERRKKSNAPPSAPNCS